MSFTINLLRFHVLLRKAVAALLSMTTMTMICFQVVEVTRNQVGPMNWFAWLQVFVCIYPYHEPILPDAFPMSSSHHMLLGVNRSNQGIGKRPFPGPCTAFISGPGFRSVSQAPEQIVPDFFWNNSQEAYSWLF